MTFQPPRVDDPNALEGAPHHDEFGFDVSASPDLDPLMQVGSGFKAVAEAYARRLSTPRGGLFYAPNYGRDVRLYLNAAIDAAKLSQMKSEAEHEGLQDDRVTAVSVTADYDGAKTVHLTCLMTTGFGDFALTLAVTKVTVEILAAEAA